MVGLLDLPLELREPILLEVVLETIEQKPAEPRSPYEADNDDYRVVKVRELGSALWTSDLTFCKSLKRHAMPLLHINQQIRGEVIDIMLRRLAQRTDDARLDMTFDVDPEFLLPSTLWATWLSAPFPAFNMNTVHAQIRFFQVEDGGTLPHRRPGDNMKDCDSWIDPRVANLLLNFVASSLHTQAGSASIHERRGITTPGRSRPSDRTIQKLVFDIPVDPDIPDSREGLVRCLMCPGSPSISDGEFFCMIPSGKRAALIFARYLHESLLQIFNELVEYPVDTAVTRMIFERVGSIDLNVHGRLFGRVNLGQILAMVPRNEKWSHTDLSRTEFFTWKRAAEDKRKTAGFETVNPSVQEHHLTGGAGLICSILAARDDSLLDEEAGFSDDDAQPVGQPASHNQVAFTGKALFIQEDGSKIAGDATFYCPSYFYGGHMHVGHDLYFPPQPSPPFPNHSLSPSESETISHGSGFVRYHPGGQQREEELVLFEGEAIVFPAQPRETIISGDAIFYGRKEDVRAKQPPGST